MKRKITERALQLTLNPKLLSPKLLNLYAWLTSEPPPKKMKLFDS